MAAVNDYLDGMLQAVADALGPELLREVAFVGGCTTSLMLTDEITKAAVRFTDDVDLIIHVMGHSGWKTMRDTLYGKGFRESLFDTVICRMRLKRNGHDDLIVDFMPDDGRILGFTNRWYADALQTATDMPLNSGTVIRVVTPVHFVATKLEAWLGRGNNDPLASRDMEDLLNVVDGRPELLGEVAAAPALLQAFIAREFTALLAHPDFDYAVQSTAKGSAGRENIIFTRWEAIAAFNKE